ncbi:MAG: TIM barrel protein [Gemmataceae bacterium]
MFTAISRRSFLASAAAIPPALALTQTQLTAQNPTPKPTFQLGLVSYNVSANWDLATTLEICKRVGIAALECRTTHKHGVEPSLSAAKRADVKKQFADSGVVFWGCGSVCEFHSDNPDVVKKNIETCKSFIGLAAELGGKGVKVRPNGVAKGMTVQAACQQIGKALIECGKAASDAGVEIWVEVHGAVTQDPKNMKLIMEACGHPSVGVTWNSNDGEVVNGSLTQSFDLLSKFIRSCHINDLDKDKSGKYPYRELFTKLKGIGYDRYTMCEVGKSYSPKEGEAFLKQYKEKWMQLMAG